jgi:predicted Rossmann fold flavoprotein
MIASDVAIVGAGAAGLATAIFTARRIPTAKIVALDGAPKLGAKILVSGGGRCNVTNEVVRAEDFFGGSHRVIQRVLSHLGVEQTLAFFKEIGVTLHLEENGTLFPDSNSARTVLNALVDEARRLGVELMPDHRVNELARSDDGFHLVTSHTPITAKCVVLATGGLSLPKTGSDGGGYALARAMGHSLVPTTPGLVPLRLTGQFHVGLSGITQDVELSVHVEGEKVVRLNGSMLWTHFGASGPVVMNASRLWHRARLEKKQVSITASFSKGEDSASLDAHFVSLAVDQPKKMIHAVLSRWLPARVAAAMLAELGVEQTPMAHLSREARRKIVMALTAWPLPVYDSRGYGYAEVTSGGVPLEEIDSATMESRKCPGLFLVGEILDVDGRIGGYNFQWAWSGAFTAGDGLIRALTSSS